MCRLGKLLCFPRSGRSCILRNLHDFSLSLILCTPLPPAEMSVRMSNLDNERDERDEDSHEDRGISEFATL